MATPPTARPNVLPLEGEIDLHVSPRIAGSLSAMVSQKPKHLVVDLSRVTYMDRSTTRRFGFFAIMVRNDAATSGET